MRNKKNYKKGYVMTSVAVMFVAISVTVVFGLLNPVLAQIKNATRAESSRQSYYLAESAIEDVMYRLKNNLTVSSSETVSLNGEEVTVYVSDTLGGKTITTESDYKNSIRKIGASVTAGSGASFNYAIQSGNGGFSITSSTVNGNIYSNGHVIGDSGTVNGSISAASVSNITPDQINNTPTTPAVDLTFGASTATQDLAQSFQVDEDVSLNKMRIFMRKTGSPSDIVIRLAFDNGGQPGTFISSVDQELFASVIGTTYGWVDIVLKKPLILQANTTYWFVLDKKTNSGSYTVGANGNGYANGLAKTGRYPTTWNNTSPSGLDIYFELYSGLGDSKIEGQDGSWDLVVNGDSSAYEVSRTNTGGNIYCQIGSDNANGKTCNTSGGIPSPQGYPISESNINTWKSEVDVSGSGSWKQQNSTTIDYAGITETVPVKINGNLTISCNADKPASFSDLHVTGNVLVNSRCTFRPNGIMKIDGNLTIDGGSLMRPAGTVWVAGNITVSGGSSVILSETYGSNSGIIFADGRISVTGNGQFGGSGSSNSFPLLVTASNCPSNPSCSNNPAIGVSGGSGAVILVSPNGTLTMSGGTDVKAIVAHRIEIAGGALVNYESGLIDLSFSSGPSGGWNIQSWGEIE